MKKLLALLLVLAMLMTLVACGGSTSESSKVEESSSSVSSKADDSSSEEESAEVGRFDALQTTDEEMTLYLYFHGINPTVNTEPTEESSTVRNANREIAEKWLADKPNVTIDWCFNVECTEEWVTVNYTAGTGPDTLFYWGGSKWIERGMALVLEDAMNSPNYYEPGSPKWRDMFPEYLFDGTESQKMAINDRKEIIAVPTIVAPGALTAYYVNKDLQAELGFDHNPSSWEEMKEQMLAAYNAGYVATIVYNYNNELQTGGSWDAQFSLCDAYMSMMIDDVDYNGDGKADGAEALRKQWEEGYFYLQNNPRLEEYFEEYFWKIHNVMEDGALNIDYSQQWTDGNVLFYEDGLWALSKKLSDPEIDFEVGAFPVPLQVAADSEYVMDIPLTESGPYKPDLAEAINVMNPESQNKPDYIADYVIDYMKCMTTNENLSLCIAELGVYFGATKDCAVPAALADWVTNRFPMASTAYSWISAGCSESTSAERTALYEEYMYNMIDHDTWVIEYDELLYKGLCDYFNYDSADDDKAFWAEEYGFDVSIWDAEPVKPPHMA